MHAKLLIVTFSSFLSLFSLCCLLWLAPLQSRPDADVFVSEQENCSLPRPWRGGFINISCLLKDFRTFLVSERNDVPCHNNPHARAHKTTDVSARWPPDAEPYCLSTGTRKAGCSRSIIVESADLRAGRGVIERVNRPAFHDGSHQPSRQPLSICLLEVIQYPETFIKRSRGKENQTVSMGLAAILLELTQ